MSDALAVETFALQHNPWRFSAYQNTAQSSVSTGTTVTFDTELFDPNNNFTTGAGALYTVPVQGVYLFVWRVGWQTATTDAVFAVNNTTQSLEVDGAELT